MKLRTTLFVALIALLLAACTFTLAEDVTPPPGYVAPTPAPTHGPVFPAQAPDVQNGAALYAEKCVDCHGATGLGDGAQSAQLPVSVPPLALPEIASEAAPEDWYLIVTLGNIDNFMPPFASLTDQECWDVVAYAQSLSGSPEQISQGEQLFNENCADCPTELFTNQEKMAKLSTDALITLLAEGEEGLPALGDTLSQDELTAIAAYVRTLSYGAPSVAAEPASTEAPSDEEAPTEGGEQAEVAPEAPAEAVEAVEGSVSGKLVNGSGGDAPSGVEVTLHGFEHATDMSSTPAEVVTETVRSNDSGEFTFEDVDISEGRIFLVEANFEGTYFQSDLAVSEAGMAEVSIPELIVYESTMDTGGLVVEQLHVSFDMAVEGSVQVFELFTISNMSDKAYVFNTDGSSLPFMPLPTDAVNVGLELSQDSAPLVSSDLGLAIPPSEDFYSIIAYFDMPYDKELTLTQPLLMPVSSALVIVPEGIKVKTDQLTDEGIQQTQQGVNIQMYSGSGLNAGSSLEMTLSGKVKAAGSSAIADNRQTLLIGAGVLGVVLILAGVYMFMRDRSQTDEDEFEDFEDEDEEFDSAEDVMDAIIALDDLHRAKKIPDEAYQQRREELKERLKDLA